jgi:hypothetical protein
MKKNFSAVFILLATLIVPASLSAKGPPVKITIKGGDLSTPIDITDPNILKEFSVWAGPGVGVNGIAQTEGFIIDWSKGLVVERPDGLHHYEVLFYANHRGERLVYVVSYDYNPSTEQGYVYLPGKAEEWYQLNTFSIFRGLEGNWFLATSAWQNAVRPIIARAKTAHSPRK